MTPQADTADTPDMTDTIAVANQAGGAGKTTTALGLAGAYANQGRDTLLIDLDPQGVTTEGTGFKNRDGEAGDIYHQKVLSLHQVLTDPARTAELNDVIEHHAEFDVIPANMAMKGLKDKLGQVANAEMRLKLALEELTPSYDVIILDCPPDLSRILDNALVAAENVVIPVQPKRRFVSAVEDMQEEITYLENSFPNVSITIRALVINEIDDRSNDNDQREMLEFWHDGPWPTYDIHQRTAIKRAWNSGKSIFQHNDRAKTDDVRETYRQLARDIAGRLQETGMDERVNA
jgi:chromosome partitioning protein